MSTLRFNLVQEAFNHHLTVIFIILSGRALARLARAEILDGQHSSLIFLKKNLCGILQADFAGLTVRREKAVALLLTDR